MKTPLTSSIAKIAALLAALAVNLFFDHSDFAYKGFLIDFKAFYCAGSAQAAGENPYRVEPLRSCEQRTLPVPAPLPGYALAFFSLFSHLPFNIAAALWELLLAITVAAAVIALALLTKIEPLIIFTSFLFSDAIDPLIFGQIIPLAVAALAVGMLCISQKHYGTAAFCVILSLIEPHVGLGSCLSLFLFSPRSRTALTGGIGLLLLVSVASHTLSHDVEYVKNVLPSHVLSEINNEDQYSLTHVLAMLGTPEHTAATLGSLSYFVFLGAGLYCAQAIRMKTHDEAFLIALPPAFTLIGGPFLHIHQMAAALPAAFLLLARLPVYRFPLSIAIFLLAIPWGQLYRLIHFGPLIAITALILSARLLQVPLAVQGLLSICSMLLGFITVQALTSPARQPHPIPLPLPNASAEATWRMLIDTTLTGDQALFLILKIPTWIALFLIAGISYQAGRRICGEKSFESKLPAKDGVS